MSRDDAATWTAVGDEADTGGAVSSGTDARGDATVPARREASVAARPGTGVAEEAGPPAADGPVERVGQTAGADTLAGAGLTVAVLGPLSAAVDGRDVPLPGRRERMVLAVLAAARRSPVAADRLIDELWAGGPPATAAAALQVCVSRLRSTLEPGRRPRTASVIVTTPGGYELRLPHDAVDADRFADALDDARAALSAGHVVAALARLDAGLALWRGAAYADRGDLVGPGEEAGRLDELRLLAYELRLDAMLALGRHAEAVPDAELLVREHPFRERLTELAALALYRSGRQADALAVLARTRKRLADELGVDPRPALRSLESDILAQAPRLDAGVRATYLLPAGPGAGDGRVGMPESVSAPSPALAPVAPGTPAITPHTPTASTPASHLAAARVRPDAADARHAGRTAALAPSPPVPGAPAVAAPPAEPLTGALPRPGSDADGPAPIIGRRPQLAALDVALADTLAGRGGLVVVSGEPGIGKTRLLAELRDRARLLGVRTLWGRCHETDAAPAFWAWRAIVRDADGDPSGSDNAPGGSAFLGVDGAHAADGPDTGELGMPSAPWRVYEAVTQRLARHAAAHGPVAVVLDDIHWADPSSLHLLGYAAEMLAGHPVLLAVTMRDNHPRPDTALDACLATLARSHPVRLHLAGLDPAEIGELLRQSVGADIGCAIANMIHARADGNPFYARELARLLARDTGFDMTGARSPEVPEIPEIPDGVRDVVRRRVGLLPETGRTVLRLASVAGRGVDADLLAEVSGGALDDLLDACDLAAAHGLLEETGAGHYRFTHALVRETLYDDLGAGRRGRLHGDIGSVLEGRLPERPELLDDVAYHLALGAAMRPALADAAVRHGIAAARQAGLQYAYDDACARWQRTADLVAARPGLDPRVRFDVMHGLGTARRQIGDLAGAQRALTDAVRLARELDDAELLAVAAVANGGPELWNWREYGAYDTEVIAVLEQSHAALPDGPLRCRVTANLAVELVYTWDARRADALSAEAVEAARRLGDPETLMYALGCRYLAIWRPGTAPERLAAVEELTALVRSLGCTDLELVARFLRAVALVELGRVAEADAQAAACEALAARLRRSSTAIQLTWWQCMRMLMDGRGEDVLALLPDAVRTHRATTLVGHSECEGAALAQAAELTGRLHEVLPRLVELVDGSPYPVFHAVVARAALVAGRPELAARLLPPAPPADFAGSWQSLATDCLRAEVLAGLGRLAEMAQAEERIRPYADTIAMYGSIGCFGSAHYYLGVCAEARGDTAAAAEAFTRAADAHRAAGVRSWLSRSETRLAALGKPGG
ncbi:BTAD domain-containing putative transcriptional regulator [Yinghuangia seranimata]|uniref:BTAD domain-containing putative transcriptional regulator n=1 Tax=Yinghuangia seranimata TaxID=408067 RepID=UPI00248C9AC1|nr:BTAD domain-containing putative transcriptional regulator [Yinghuangia seranimata]MDI2124624.1 BTAD domain-containing putative transcriptional regulator [Yinghuangia seranimata]